MLTHASRVFLPMSLAGLVLAVGYAAFSGDPLGVTLFVMLALAAGFVAVIVGGSGDRPALLTPELRALSSESLPTIDTDLSIQPGGGGWPMLGALAAGLLAISFVVGSLAAYAGLGVAAVTTVGWTARLVQERTGRHVDLSPIGLPVVGLFAIASLMFFMSRVLLAVSETGSWVFALVVAAAIVLVAAVVSVRPQMSSGALASVLVVGSLLMVGGGLVAAAKGERSFEAHGAESGGAEAHEEDSGEPKPGEAHSDDAPPGNESVGTEKAKPLGVGGPDDKPAAPGPSPAPVKVAARDIAFDVTTISLAADTPSRIAFDNADAEVPHNIAIYRTAAGAAGDNMFRGALITGPATTTYEFVAPPAGTYYFRCDVHPNMAGEVEVA